VSAEDELFDWLVDGAPGATTSPEVVERLARGLIAAGVPVERLYVFVRTLHPTVLARQFRFTQGEPVKTAELTAAIQASPAFENSPITTVARTRTEVRRRLDAPLDASDFGIVHDLRKEGFTDYLCVPLSFLGGETHAATFMTREPGGFTEAHLATIRRILRPLTRLAEIFALRRVATNLLSTYVGHDTGEKILAGRIMKGDVEEMRAVIWFSDLRGFTEMSSRLTPRAIIDTLNELFECQVPAIENRGGEVLKFIGDGLLGIFPIGASGDARARCESALAAAEDAFTALDERNTLSVRNASPIPQLHFGLALHVGEFAYGNIGGASRLDFTAIGPAVNLAARLEGLTSKLVRRIVVSSDFAEIVGGAFDDLGEFDLKGVGTKQRVFAPRATQVG
jgi:adenylate cyclase